MRTGATLTTAILFLLTAPVFAGWPYFTNKQYVEDAWLRGSCPSEIKSDSQTSSVTDTLRFNFYNGKVTLETNNSIVWAEYEFVKGNIFSFETKTGENRRSLMLLLERKGRDKMIWWLSNSEGEKVREYRCWDRFRK